MHPERYREIIRRSQERCLGAYFLIFPNHSKYEPRVVSKTPTTAMTLLLRIRGTASTGHPRYFPALDILLTTLPFLSVSSKTGPVKLVSIILPSSHLTIMILCSHGDWQSAHKLMDGQSNAFDIIFFIVVRE